MLMKMIAKFLANKHVAEYLVERAKKTPYQHLEGYMNRWWLFNPYSNTSGLCRFPKLPVSIRVHHILRKDLDRHMHDHPWDARTFIIKGWYVEEREGTGLTVRKEGDTATLNFGEFHRIDEVSEGGVYTVFVTFRYRGTWGFKVEGNKVQWRKYLGIDS